MLAASLMDLKAVKSLRKKRQCWKQQRDMFGRGKDDWGVRGRVGEYRGKDRWYKIRVRRVEKTV